MSTGQQFLAEVVPTSPPRIRSSMVARAKEITASLCIAVALSAQAPAVTYEGQTGEWMRVVATAYSPSDALDAGYRATKGADRWRTAYGVDVREVPYGIAAPTYLAHAEIIIPSGQGYLDRSRPYERTFTVDDTGAMVRRRSAESGRLHLDLRYRTEASARRFGTRELWVFIVSHEGKQP